MFWLSAVVFPPVKTKSILSVDVVWEVAAFAQATPEPEGFTVSL